MVSLIHVLSLVFLLFTTFYHLGEANKFLVGGSQNGWKVPEPSKNMTLNDWAASERFRIGDSLEFDYDIKKDSVLQVTKENYEKCITEKPTVEYKMEPTIVKLEVSGPHYFISGAPGNCVKGEKVNVVVQSPHHPPTPTPKPVPVPATAPPTPSKPTTSPAPAPANNTAVGLVAGSGIFWAFVAVIGLAYA